ncbi:hypothetical protein NESM_000600800 [Novymonas esmeraldas]|uniref:Uncharacterized protein n=1 Tax=Novymonas esmeraldas TaxID=1808958 RepID=A0AAW0ESM2_9TRYP
MALRFLGDVCAFHDAEASRAPARRRALMLASLSPTARAQALMTVGLALGPFTFHCSRAGMSLQISGEAPPPPVGWWQYAESVSIAACNATVPACVAVRALKSEWGRCRVTEVELTEDDEVGAVAQEHALDTLRLLRDELHSLTLSNFHIRPTDSVPRLSALRSLSLECCSGAMEKWVTALSFAAERVDICDCFSISAATFADTPAAGLARLVLDNTNVNAPWVEGVSCAASLQTLSLIDCRKIDELDIDAFPKLQRLLLGRTLISNASLAGAEKCGDLRLVNLGGCQRVTDVSALQNLAHLRELFLHETAVTNAGIAALARCARLEKLNLGGCIHVSNVNHLGCLQHLLELHLWSTKVTNAGIHGLSTCCSLVELVLDDCIRVSDVTPLASMPSIRWLSLIGTRVNVAGVKELVHCRTLETLALSGTEIPHPPKLWRQEAVATYLRGLQ